MQKMRKVGLAQLFWLVRELRHTGFSNLFTKIIGFRARPFKAKCFWSLAQIPVTKTYVANPTAPLSDFCTDVA